MKIKKLLSLLLAVLMVAGIIVFAGAESSDATVESVTSMLEDIHTLQQMQDNRYTYTASGHWDLDNQKQSTIDLHTAKRTAYETYVSEMMEKRAAAQRAYDSLTAEEQAEIDPALVAKLSSELPTTIRYATYNVSPRYDEYIYEAVKGDLGYAYEVGNHMVGGTIPQTFVVVDTSDGNTTWTPSGEYEHGVSNYDVTYCCDYTTDLVWGSDYKRINLEESEFFGEEAAKHIRAIVTNSYPFVSIEEMKEGLIEGGLSESYVNSLTRADIIGAVQMAIWRYSNSDLITEKTAGYYASLSVTKNTGVYFTPLHDYSNEIWDWFPGKRTKTYDSRAAYRVDNLIYYLCNLEGIEASEDNIVVSDIKVGRQDILSLSEGLYSVGLHVILSSGCQADDDIKLRVVSYHEDEEGNIVETATNAAMVGSSKEYAISIAAKEGDTIKVYVEGTQNLEKGVYFYEAEGGYKASQSMVGVCEGATPIYAEAEFVLERDVDMGIRIYKKSSKDKAPISDITFHVYNVEPGEGETIGETPTAADVEKYAVPENLVGSMVTDLTGYAAMELPKYGTYLVIEEHNTAKVESPADPFFIYLPWAVEKDLDGETVIEYLDVVSVYPKNTPIVPPPPPPPPPPKVYGAFEIIKHDSSSTEVTLAGAEFKVYRAATEADEAISIETILVGGKEIEAVPVTVDGAPLILTTDENGKARSPQLDCGIYYLKETKAPAGYVMLEDAQVVDVVANSVTETVYAYVANERGIHLPETGGMGTKIFITSGTVLVVIAAASIIEMRRRRALS